MTLTLLASSISAMHMEVDLEVDILMISPPSLHDINLYTSSSDIESEAGKANGLGLTFFLKLSNSSSSGVI